MTKDAVDAVTEIQGKVLDAIKVGHEATLTAVREAADAFAGALPKMPEWLELQAYSPRMPDFVALPSFETLIGFTEKVWESQREFNVKMYEAIAPIGRSAFGSAKETANEAAKAGEAAKSAAEHTSRSAAAKA